MHQGDAFILSFFLKRINIWIHKTVDSCNTPQRPPLSPSILNAISKKFRITLIIVSLNLTDTYIHHLNWFNSSNQCSKQLGYFSCFNSRMGYRLKSTTHYSLHAQSLEKLSCINLYRHSNSLLVKRRPPHFQVWVGSQNILGLVEFLTNNHLNSRRWTPIKRPWQPHHL